MRPESMKFHQKHTSSVHLSEDRTVAKTTNEGARAIFFFHRPLAPKEKLVLNFIQHVGRSHFYVEATATDPNTYERDAPCSLESRDWEVVTGYYGFFSEILIYLEETTSRPMIKFGVVEPRAIYCDCSLEKPSYIVFWCIGRNSEFRISSTVDSQPPQDPANLGALPFRIRSETFKNLVLRPAQLTSFEQSKVKVRANCAVSHDLLPSRGNFAFVDTPLKPDSALIVELTALKWTKPVQIVLTIKDARRAFSCEHLSKLCDTTYSLMMESEVPEAGDELAVRISPSGAVFVSNNNRGWRKRMVVDTDFEYNVIFAMEHISVLTVIGIATGLGEVDEPEFQSAVLSECVVCREKARDVLIIPCSHVVLCEDCALSLRKLDEPRCPMCRESVVDVRKVHIA